MGVQCGYCEFKFLQEELNEHIQNHMTTCSICKEVMLKDAVESHLESTHKVECEHCKENMLSTVVEDHIDLIHKKECTFCGERILTHNMSTYVRQIHEPEECDECGDRFATKSMLKDHIDEFHLVEKCDECTARFRTEEELTAVDEYTNVSEEELAETNEYMKELVLRLADDVVKDKMTGTILFSLRFDETDQDEVSDSDCES